MEWRFHRFARNGVRWSHWNRPLCARCRCASTQSLNRRAKQIKLVKIFSFSILNNISHIPISRTNGAKSALPLNGNTEHLIGAITAGNEKYDRASSPSLDWKRCSNNEYMMRPMPNDGSITLGVNSSTWSVFCEDFTCTMALSNETVVPLFRPSEYDLHVEEKCSGVR